MTFHRLSATTKNFLRLPLSRPKYSCISSIVISVRIFPIGLPNIHGAIPSHPLLSSKMFIVGQRLCRHYDNRISNLCFQLQSSSPQPGNSFIQDTKRHSIHKVPQFITLFQSHCPCTSIPSISNIIQRNGSVSLFGINLCFVYHRKYGRCIQIYFIYQLVFLLVFHISLRLVLRNLQNCTPISKLY